MAFIKNIDHEKVLNLASQITAAPGQIVSKTLAQNKAVSLTLNGLTLSMSLVIDKLEFILANHLPL